MIATLRKTFQFEAAHWLPAVPSGHKCGAMHGHSYQVVVELQGEVEPTAGWVVDAAVVSAAWRERCGGLDHSVLNELDGLANPTSENLACWVGARLRSVLPGVRAVEVWETRSMSVRVEF